MAFVPAHWECDLCGRHVQDEKDLKAVPVNAVCLTVGWCSDCLEKAGLTEEKRKGLLDAQYRALFGKEPPKDETKDEP